MNVGCCTAFLLVAMTALPEALCQENRDELLERARSRLQAIYERGEFRARRFRARWLRDGSGYTVSERDPETKKMVRVRYDCASGERTVLGSRRGEARGSSGVRSPDGKRVVASDGGDLFLRDLESRRRIQLTHQGGEGPISCSRPLWSPDGKWIAFVRSDASRVRTRSVLVPGDPTYPEVRKVRFARVGGTIPALRVGVVDALGKETRWLAIPEPSEGFYLGQIGWAGNSHELLVEKLSRFRNEREFLLADVRTGSIARIFHEKDRAWVVASYGKNAGYQWIRGGRSFLVLSEMDGWRHAYIYSREGEQQALLTPGSYDIIERGPIDEAGGWFYYDASPDNATQSYLFRVRLDGTEPPERLTPRGQPGTHRYQISPNARWAFHTYSSFDTPPLTELVRLPGHEVVRVLEDNAELRKRIASPGRPQSEFLKIEIDRGVVMDAWMIKPPGFDRSRKYPVLVYVYGEPHAQTVLDAWGSAQADYHRAVAELGYLVVSIDNRGTPAPKGAAWRRAIFGSLGPLSTKEQAAALRALARSRPWVDLSRVAIWGWSGGGSNTLNAMFREPQLYRVGIAVAPKPQPHLYNAWFQEIYMETPEVNPEGYRRSAPINFAQGLRGDLLIIQGTGETNTHIQITEGLVDRLIALGKPFDYMTYPNRDHGIRKGRGTTMHLRMLMVRYLLEHLPPGAR